MAIMSIVHASAEALRIPSIHLDAKLVNATKWVLEVYVALSCSAVHILLGTGFDAVILFV